MSEPRKPRLILHIGLEKTGTTALQRFFSRNRRMLGVLGLQYPAVPGDAKSSKQHDLAATLDHMRRAGAPHPDHGHPSVVLERYLEKARRSKATLISAEELSAPDPAIAALFAPHCKDFDLRVIVFLRRQDEWALSAWRERVVNPAYAEARHLADWLDDPATRAMLDFDAMLEGWRKVVGRQAIRVLRYPYETPLLPHFLQASDLPASLGVLPYHGKRVRESVGEEILLQKLAENGGTPDPVRFDQAARDALLDQCRAGNTRLCQLYRPELPELFGRA